MIDTASALRQAIKRNQFTGVILYEGQSAIDGAPIVAIANRIIANSANAKTGAMVQTFIIRADVNPFTAIKDGRDHSICGDCPQRPFKGGKCYVDVAKSVVEAQDFENTMLKAYIRDWPEEAEKASP